MRKRILSIIILIFLIGSNIGVLAQDLRYPDYAYMYLGPDKHENYNRKMFNFDLRLNKYVIRPIHIIWASILPQFVMDRIFGVSNNIEYPIRLVSSLVQKDFQNAGNETKRFLVNTTIGLAGMFDPAKRLLKIERSRDNMDKAFARRNIKPGTYFVAPVIAFTTVRGLFGRVFDVALNPTTYIATPLLAIIKAGIMINRTSYHQSIIQFVESNYADPYEITKKAFGIDGYIKKSNYDRVNIFTLLKDNNPDSKDENIKMLNNTDAQLNVSAKIIDKNTDKSNCVYVPQLDLKSVNIEPDIYLTNYHPQSPVVDSMRTALFILPKVNDSIWNEISPWNRSFAKRIKMSSIVLTEGKKEYCFKYLLQKDKNSPLIIIIPSTGDGIKASHPVMFAKLFYDAGFSVVIHGNPFQWEYVLSMPDDYRPGLPANDAKMLRSSIGEIVNHLEEKNHRKFNNKVILGTSLAGIDVLFLASQESKENTLGNVRYISICPPIDLIYSLKKVDEYMDEWKNFHDDLKDKVALTSAKLVKLYQSRKDIDFEITKLPFDEDEAKLITSFIMHQKLSDIIFTVEKAPNNKASEIYDTIYRMGFEDYMTKYVMAGEKSWDRELDESFGLSSISDYLCNFDNYKIFHTQNDYLINKNQLKQLKYYSGSRLVIFDNGSHMGFLYRPEFIAELLKTIQSIKEDFDNTKL